MRTQTSQNRVQFACALRTIVLGVFAVLVCALAVSLLHPVATYAATNGTINFQARLETSAGAIVPDGNYNVEFKLYSAASGGTAEWTEDYTYNSGAGSSDARIRVANGYLSVSLGALCAFTTGTCQGHTETAPNWNQQQWLTMNIGGTGASGSYPTMGDGEMAPRIQLTAVPYAFTSGSLSSTDGSGHTGTLSFPTSLSNTTDTITLPDASGTVCLQNASACGFATGSGSAFLQGGNSFGAQAVLGTNDSNSLAVVTGGTNRIVIDTGGNLQFQQASTLYVAQPGTAGNGLQLTIKGGDANGSGNTGGTLLLQGGAGGGTAASGTVLVKSNGNNSTSALQVQNASGNKLFTVDTSNNAIILGNDGTPSALTIRGGAATSANTTGSNITFDASNGTGSGGSGDFIFRTATPINTAVTLDNAIHGDDNTGPTVTSYTTGSFTVASHTNRLLLVSVSTTGTTAVNTVTYGSDTLTKLDGVNSPNVLGGTRLEVWYKLNPTVQTATVTVTSLTGTHFSVGVASYYNVDQSVPTDVTTTGSTTPTSLPVTTTTSQLVYDTIAADNSGITSNTSGATVRWTDTYVTLDAGQDKAGLAGTTTMSWKAPSSGWAEMAIALNPVANNSSDIFTDRLHITAAGNVGINNTNPQFALSVGSTLNVDTTNLRLNVGAGATGEATPSLLVLDSQTGSASDPAEVDGAMYYNVTLQEFRCGRNGVWSSCGVNPIDRGYDIEDDFMGGNTTITPAGGDIGQLGWTCAGGGTSTPTVAYNTTLLPTADRPGILQINSSASSGSGCTLVTGSAGSLIINNTIDIKSGAAVGATITNNILRIGAHSETTAGTRPVSGIWWEADSSTNARWEYCYGNGTAATCAAATTGNGFAANHNVTASTFARLEIRVLSGTSATYCIDGDCVTKTGLSIDETNAVSPAIACFNSSAAARACYVDYYQIQGVASAAR